MIKILAGIDWIHLFLAVSSLGLGIWIIVLWKYCKSETIRLNDLYRIVRSNETTHTPEIGYLCYDCKKVFPNNKLEKTISYRTYLMLNITLYRVTREG